MNGYYLKIFLKEKTNVLECLKLSEYLETHDLVEETHIVLDNLIEVENDPLPSSHSPRMSQQKYEAIMKRLARFRNRWGED